MKSNILLLMFLVAGNTFVTAQVGILTPNPQGPLHVDGAKDNPATGIPTTIQQVNDVIITTEGSLGVGTIAPDSSSSVEVNTTSKGFLPPRMTNTQRDGIALPATGLMIYSTTSKCLQTNIGTPASPNWGCVAVQGSTGAPVVQVNSYTPNTPAGSAASETCLGSLCVRHNGNASEGSILLRSNTGASIPNSSIAGFQVATSGINMGDTEIVSLTTSYTQFYRGGASGGEFINYQVCTGTGENYRIFLTMVAPVLNPGAGNGMYLLNLEKVR
ncbi:hypothetical protein [Chryseobacterium ginsenosidimutans]|uniref:hypothetical protein n=1 Tax=Chryseobacterium ginsenosidimutans TaxID=687846 RepID=UPI0031D51590